MKVTTHTRYAIRFLLDLATAKNDAEPMSVAQISARTGISRRYLERIAISLKNAGLVRAVSGRGGGYVLLRSVDEITIYDVITAASGPVTFVHCVNNPTGCMQSPYCECRPLWVLISDEIENVLSSYVLGDLINKSRLSDLRARARTVDKALSANTWS